MYSRTERVIGKDNLNKIKNSKIAVLGVGGVGGYVVEMLTRLGVGFITIVDFDKVDVSNLNRQVIALNSTVGLQKVDLFKNRILDINPNCNVVSFNQKISGDNIGKIIDSSFDFVVDAIDDLPAKVGIARYCEENNINLISAMGTGNRYKLPQFEVCDIAKTSYDKLAKKLRKMLKDANVNKLTVCFTKESPEKTESLGSVVYYPLMCAGTIVSYVTNKIIETL